MIANEAIEVLKANYPDSCYELLREAVDVAIKALKERTEIHGDMIYRQAAIVAVHKNYDTILDFKSDGRTVAYSFEDIINALPAAQPERKIGKWIDRNGNIVAPFWERYECSECGARFDNSKYCPNCGAKMQI